jgi:hypothetical protein
VAEEVRGAGIILPAAVLITKADLPGAGVAAARAGAAFPGLPLATTSREADRRPVADLAWRLLDRIRVSDVRPHRAALPLLDRLPRCRAAPPPGARRARILAPAVVYLDDGRTARPGAAGTTRSPSRPRMRSAR